MCNQKALSMGNLKKILIIIVFSIFIGLIIWSCEKEDIDIDLKSNNWVVVKIKKQGESSYSFAKDSYILKFINDSILDFNLDVNSCSVKYNIISNGNIEWKKGYCTEICCDSDFAMDSVQLIPKMTKYYGKGKELIFEGQGEIILKQK